MCIHTHTPYRSTQIIKEIPTYTKGETDGKIIILGDYNMTVTSMERSSRQKINKATEILNDTIEQ